MPFTSEINTLVFKDIDFNFKAHPVTKDVPILTNANAVKRSLRNLVLTNFSEKPYNMITYSNVLHSLFENFTPALVSKLRDQIETVCQFEPRAQIKEINISDDVDMDRNGIHISIIFSVVNKIRLERVEIFLEKIR